MTDTPVRGEERLAEARKLVEKFIEDGGKPQRHITAGFLLSEIGKVEKKLSQQKATLDRVRVLPGEWYTQKWLDGHMEKIEPIDAVFTPQRACADELRTAIGEGGGDETHD